MSPFRSMRWRLQFWYGLFLLLALGGLSWTTYHLERTRQIDDVDDELQNRLSLVRSNIRYPSPQGGGPLYGKSRPDDDGGGKPKPKPKPKAKSKDGQPPPPRDENQAAPPSPSSSEPERKNESEPQKSASEAAARPPDEGKESAPRIRKSPTLRLNPETDVRFTAANGYYYVIWLRNGPDVTYSANAPRDIPKPKETPKTGERVRGDFHEVYAAGNPGDITLVGRDMSQDLAELRSLAVFLSSATAAVLVLGLLGGWWLVTSSLKPIDEISATAVKIASGDLSQRIHLSNNASELDRLVSILNSTFSRLDAAFAQQARFTGDAAHELRTPVTVMLTHAQSALQTPCSAPEHKESFEACQRTAQRMRRLLESLLELARMDAGQESFKNVPFNLTETVADCMELVQPLADHRQITIRGDLVPAELHGDPDRLAQVFINLISNAIHHNRDGGTVEVSIRTEEKMISVVVADNGPGIPAEALPHIFERFYRADKARTTVAGRSGLGLAISKAIVEVHGGRISVKSELGQGAEFTVQFPVARNA